MTEIYSAWSSTEVLNSQNAGLFSLTWSGAISYIAERQCKRRSEPLLHVFHSFVVIEWYDCTDVTWVPNMQMSLNHRCFLSVWMLQGFDTIQQTSLYITRLDLTYSTAVSICGNVQCSFCPYHADQNTDFQIRICLNWPPKQTFFIEIKILFRQC